MAEKKQDNYKKFIKACGGLFIVILGVTLILAWWPDVVSFCKGFIGFALAVGGLLVIYSQKL